MFGKMKYGLMGIFVALCLSMFIGCDTSLNDPVENSDIVITSRAIGDTLTTVVQDGVTFVVIQTAGNTITLNMVNSQGIATELYS
jgi:ABC-type Zn uptake system ZnuABC Zn-binding protein ZnuA